VSDYCDVNREPIVTDFAKLICHYYAMIVDIFPNHSTFIFLRGVHASVAVEVNDEALARELTERIRALYTANEASEIIARCYLEAIAVVSLYYTNDEINTVLPEMVAIYERFPKELINADSLALLIRNYTPECEASEIEIWLDKVLAIYADFEDCEEILSYCLSILEDYVLETGNGEKTETILSNLIEGKDFTAGISDELRKSYEDLLESIREVRGDADE
jgi:hypothetical protein